MAKGDVNINQAIIECRYKKNLLFYDISKLDSIVKKNSDSFNNTNYDKKNESLRLDNQQKGISAFISDARSFVSINDCDNIECFSKPANKLIKTIFDGLEIDFLSRIGVRIMWGYETDDLESANNRIKELFFKEDTDIWRAFGEKNNGLRMVVASDIGKYKAKTQIFAQNTKVLEIIDGVQNKNINRNEIEIDIDISRENIEKFEYSELESIETLINERFSGIINIVGSKA